MEAPSDFAELCKLGRKSLRGGNCKQAIEHLEKARELDDENADLHESLATAHFMAGAYESAINHFQRVQKLDPRRHGTLVNLGAVYNRMGEFHKAIEVLRRCVQIEKKSAEAYYNLGIAYRKLKQPALAVPAYREALRINPKMTEAYQNLGNAFLDMNNYQQAVINFKKALELDPNFEKAKRGLSEAEQSAAAGKKAISPFGRLVSDNDMAIASVATVPARKLSEPERIADRQAVRDINASLRVEAQSFFKELSEQLDPAIKFAVRSLLEGSEMFTAQESLKHATEEFRTARRRVESVVKQLREHEATMR
jgi:tetratricopeptide (TPR) repeat protein